MRLILNISSAVFVLFFCQVAHAGFVWNNFLQHPGKEGVSGFEAAIALESGGCHKSLMPTVQEMHRLFGLVEEANDAAFRVALLASKCFGVGDLEDFYRAAGVFLERKPVTFLEIINERAVPDQDLRYMVTMLPLSLTDKLDSQISRVNRRISVVGEIRKKTLLEIEGKILGFLQDEVRNLQNIKASCPSCT